MFQIDHSFTHLAISHDKVVKLSHSINRISVKVPGVPPEPAGAYIVAWRDSPSTASLVVYLHYAQSHKAVAYVPDSPSFAWTELEETASQAHEFLESMGFMMDDNNFDTLSADKRADLVSGTPAFFADLERFRRGQETENPEGSAKETTGPSAKAQALGRLLSSF